MEIIFIVGPPGSGKTFGIRTLKNPERYFYINADFKNLTFRGWKEKFRKNFNYVEESNDLKVKEWVQKAYDAKKKDANTGNPTDEYLFEGVILDTGNALMNDSEMLSTKSLSFNEWYDVAKHMYALVKEFQKDKRDNFFFFVLFHQGTDAHDRKSVLANGRKLEKIQLEGLVNWCFFTRIEGKGAERKYLLETTNDGDSNAKRKDDAFPDVIENDYQLIIDGIKQFEGLE